MNEPAAARELFDVDIEQAMLGACLVDSRVAAEALALVEPSAFMDPLHRRLWQAITSLRERGHEATPLTVAASLANDEGLREVGGRSYLLSLARAASPCPNIVDYAKILNDLATRRALDVALENAKEALPLPHVAPLQCLAGVFEIAGQAAESAAKAAGYLPLPDALDEVMQKAEAAVNGTPPPSISTGLTDLDAITGGLQGGDMVVVAGRPGQGKTVLLGTIALAAALAGRPAILFQLEMRRSAMLHRLICDLDYDSRGSQPPLYYSRMRSGKLDDRHDEFARMDNAQRRLRALPISIFDTSGMTIHEIGAHAERFAQKSKEMGVVLIDYLQIVAPSERYANSGSKVAEVTEISNATKRLAKRLDWPVVVGCQLNRGVEQRPEKERRPALSDLRESGAIEQDADIVIGLHRPAYYIARRRPAKGKEDPGWVNWLADMELHRHELELPLLKNRSGEDGFVKVFVDIAASAVRNLQQEGNQPNSNENPGQGLLV